MQAWETWVGFLLTGVVVYLIVAPTSKADSVLKGAGQAFTNVIKALEGR